MHWNLYSHFLVTTKNNKNEARQSAELIRPAGTGRQRTDIKVKTFLITGLTVSRMPPCFESYKLPILKRKSSRGVCRAPLPSTKCEHYVSLFCPLCNYIEYFYHALSSCENFKKIYHNYWVILFWIQCIVSGLTGIIVLSFSNLNTLTILGRPRFRCSCA